MLNIWMCVYHESVCTRLWICLFTFSLLLLGLKMATSIYLSPILIFNKADWLHFKSLPVCHIILPLRGFDSVTCSRIRCAKLRNTQMFAKIDTYDWTERHRYGETDRHIDRQRDGHISSTRPHWGPLDPSVGINALRLWTLTGNSNSNSNNL